jgi:hypothetical protein
MMVDVIVVGQVVTLKTGKLIEQPKDNETLQNFSAWVANYNNFISEEYKQNSNSVSTLSPEEADVVESFITVGENN